MMKDVTVCFRMDTATDQRINGALGSQYSTRSRFIRAAIEHLLATIEAQVRSNAAKHTIQWG
jgi:predicted DNA-binding protein